MNGINSMFLGGFRIGMMRLQIYAGEPLAAWDISSECRFFGGELWWIRHPWIRDAGFRHLS